MEEEDSLGENSYEEENSRSSGPEKEQEEDSFEEQNKDLLDNEDSQPSDVEEHHAWGSKKNEFYQSSEQSDSELEDEEEKEALEIQKLRAKKLEDGDFYDEDIGQDKQIIFEDTKNQTHNPEINNIEIEKLTEEEKLNLVKEDFPELLSLLKDYKKLVLELKNKIEPLKQIIMSEPLSQEFKVSEKLKNFVCLKNDIIGSYCVYIMYYLSVKKTENFSKNHPVFAKMIQSKSMLKKISSLEHKFSNEIDELLEKFHQKNLEVKKKSIKNKEKEEKPTKNAQAKPQNNFNQKPKKKKEPNNKIKDFYENLDDSEEEKRLNLTKNKTLTSNNKGKKTDKISNEIDFDEQMDSLDEDDFDIDSSYFEDEFYKSTKEQAKAKKKIKKNEKNQQKEALFNEIQLKTVPEDEGRKITYEMLKNKGLIRKRKKIDRNARVKHRMKYKKSLTKLKSKGIYLRKREPVYKGELTGINAGLIKSVSLKQGKEVHK